MPRVDKAAVVVNASLDLNRNGDANVARLHGVKEHLINFFTFGKIHAGGKRAAGLMAVSTGLAAAIEEAHITPSDARRLLYTPSGSVGIEFAVGKEGGELAGRYALNLRRYNGKIEFSLSDARGGHVATFRCTEDEMEKGLGTLITVNLLQRIDQRPGGGDHLTQFINTGDIYLENIDLSGEILTEANLSHAYLSGAILTGTDLSGAILTEANLSYAYLPGAILTGTDLSGAILTEANLAGVDLSDADLFSAILTEATLTDTHFEGATLTNAHFEGATLANAHFEGATLTNAHFEGATLANAHFEGATLTDAHFEDATLTNAHFEGATLTDANFYGAILTGKDLTGQTLAERFLTNADVARVILTNQHVNDGTLLFAILTDKYLEGPVLLHEMLASKNWLGANLSDIDIVRTISAWNTTVSLPRKSH